LGSVTVDLVCHPQSPAKSVESISVKVSCIQGPDGFALGLRYRLLGDLEAILLPTPLPPERGSNLWEHTCFEAFVMHEDGSYIEFNFAPSRQWAVCGFTSYREGMRSIRDLPVPRIGAPTHEAFFEIHPVVYPALKGDERLALSAVIEELDGTKSYWALAHPPGKPDFHHPACFAVSLPAPE
jgi:hypothetical protein